MSDDELVIVNRPLSTLSRRGLLLGLAVAGCSRRKTPKTITRTAAAQPSPVGVDGAAPDAPSRAGAEIELLEWALPAPIERAVILLPAARSESERFPVVVALHGHGEAIKGPDAGAMGWPRDYALVRALERIGSPPLTEEDFEGLVEPAHLTEINTSLREHPFRGLIVACPYLPDLNVGNPSESKDYGKAIVEQLLPRVRRETPALTAAESTGIDGVSLGGAVALRVGFGWPEVFGAVGALQPAVYEWGTREMTDLARHARSVRPGMKLRLTTSEMDGFRRGVSRTSQALRAAGIAHDFAVLPGPHDYVFNRGPGAMELLFWHERNLAR